MDQFTYRQGDAHCENVAFKTIAAEIGTPCYIYSKASIVGQVKKLKSAFASYPTLICFAVKANSNLSVLRTIFQEDMGADLVSLGELERSLKAGVKPTEVIFSGVGKRDDEIKRALDVGIYSFNVESQAEIESIGRIAKAAGQIAPVSLRINPNIDAKTNPKISTGLFSTKFGLVEAEAMELVQYAKEHPNLHLKGIGCHIGSQILDLKPMAEACEIIVGIVKKVQSQGHTLEFIDMGGGLGIRYDEETPPAIDLYAQTLINIVKPTGLRLVIEPGRLVVGNAGVLLCSVLATKKTPKKSFVILDGAMNDLMRPAMYDAYHGIRSARESSGPEAIHDVVGPVCETGDIFGEDRKLPAVKAGDLVYLQSAGAYGSSMASNYNTRQRPAEVLVDGDRFRLVKRREKLEDLWRDEEF